MISLHYHAAQSHLSSVSTHNDVVDRDVDELDEEAYESHDGETDPGGHGYLLELFSVRLSAQSRKIQGASPCE